MCFRDLCDTPIKTGHNRFGFAAGCLFACVWTLFWSCPLPAQPVHQDRYMAGHFYPIGRDGRDTLASWEMTLSEGTWTSRYTAPGGLVAVEDTVLFAGGSLARYAYVRHVTDERSSVELGEGSLRYQMRLDGKARTARREVPPTFLVGPLVIPFIHEHWGELAQPHGLTVKYGVLDQQRTFSFRIQQTHDHPDCSDRTVVFRMRATNPVVRLFIDPLYFVFTREDRALRKIIGRTLLVRREGNSVRPVDAELVIESRLPAEDGRPHER